MATDTELRPPFCYLVTACYIWSANVLSSYQVRPSLVLAVDDPLPDYLYAGESCTSRLDPWRLLRLGLEPILFRVFTTS